MGPFGEAIPPQRPRDAEWVDEVIMTTMVNRDKDISRDEEGNQIDETTYHIHQAGNYVRNLDNLKTFYSPLLDEKWDGDKNAYSLTVWPQQAHQPSNYKSHVLLEQTIRDLGDGVIEVTYLHSNFGADPIQYMSSPWAGLRYSSLPVQLLSKPDGTWVETNKMFGPGEDGLENISDTNGAFIFAKENKPNAPALGIVFGKDTYSNRGFQTKDTKIRWGKVKRDVRNMSVFTVMRYLIMNRGENMMTRYYFVVNTVGNIKKIAPKLIDSATYGPVVFDTQTANPIKICQNQETGMLATCEATNNPAFVTFDKSFNDAYPVFAMKDKQTGREVISTNPYEINPTPYNGQTIYKKFLGWAPTKRDGIKGCIAVPPFASLIINKDYFPLSNAVQKSILGCIKERERSIPSPSLAPTISPTPTPPVSEDTCRAHCQQRGYRLGWCAFQERNCGVNQAQYTSAGDQYCPADRHFCCCSNNMPDTVQD